MLRSLIAFVVHRRLLAVCATAAIAAYGVWSYLNTAIEAYPDVTNVQVGAKVLKESIRRNGGVEGGLQQFAGAANDPDRRYASKVLAEKQRMEQAALRLRAG